MNRPSAERDGETAVPIGILTVDADLVVRTWDSWLAECTGIPSGAAVGRPLGAVVPDLAERGLLQRFEQVLVTGEVQTLAPAFHHYLVPCPPRQPSPHFDRMQQRVTLGPLRDGDRIAGVMATIEDVTARIDRERARASDLRADDWRVRREAVRDLSRDAHPDLLMSLLAALRTEHRDFNVLSSALQLLGASDVDVSEPLAALLRDPDAGLRMQAALALGERQTPAAVAALISALQDPDVNVRFHAIEALGRMRAVDAADALADIAEGDDFFLVFPAIDALGHIHDPRVAPRLLPLLRRADVIEPVADALAEIGGAEAIPALMAALNATGPAAPIARALARIHERYEQHYAGGALIVEEVHRAIAPPGAQRILDAIATGGGDSLPALVTVLGWLRGPAVERALARLLGDASVRATVIEAIARRGADTGIVDILVEQLHAEDADVRLAAIVALGRLGDRRATAGLAAMLDGDRAEIVAAASALARIGDPAAFEALLPLLSHYDAAVRQAAIGALNSLGHPGMAARVAALLSSGDARVRESAVRIAGYFGYRQSVHTVIERAADPDEGVRRAAVEHLPFLDDPRAVARLAAAFDDGSAKVRAAAAQAMAHVSSAEARGPLLSATADPDPWVRYYAVRSLAELQEPSAVPRLAELAGTDPAMHVRIAALEATGSAGAASAADCLLPYVDAPQGDLAAAALRALGRLEDPRAAPALAAALRSPDPVRRLAAVTGLRSRGSADGLAALAWTAGADADDTVSMAAVEALGAVAGRRADDAAGAIAALIGMTADALRRDRAVAELARLPETRIGAVAEGLGHRQPDVRCATIDVLARMRHPDASAAIRSALDDPEAVVREAAITALDRLGARGNGRRFAQLATDDPSRAVRRAAAAALGRAMDAPPGGRSRWEPVSAMATQSDSLGLSSSALPLLRDLIHERLGLHYDPGRFDTLADRLSPLVVERGFDSFLDYYYLLKYDEHAADEWPRVMDALSVPETYFWREIDQIQAIVRHVVPALLEAQPAAPVRIWCVPCATGEEPLTIAMVLEDAGLFARGAIEIHASDASPAAIRKAEAGRFRERAFRALPPAMRERYFSRDGEAWVVSPALHRRVTSWSLVNLRCEGDVAPFARAPIIFCRNVFIYFSPEAIGRAVAQFGRSMPAPGYLCLGASESLLRMATRFDLEQIGGAFVYVKRP